MTCLKKRQTIVYNNNNKKKNSSDNTILTSSRELYVTLFSTATRQSCLYIVTPDLNQVIDYNYKISFFIFFLLIGILALFQVPSDSSVFLLLLKLIKYQQQ